MDDLIENPNNKLPEIAIKEFESNVGSKFPDVFKLFLIDYNGGRASERCNILFQDKKRLLSSGASVSCYHGFGNSLHLNFVNDYRHASSDLPELLVPFADNGGGNVFLISLRNDASYGMIYYSHHEYEHSISIFNEERGELPPCMAKVCDSFEKFVEKLHY
jgi:hypothetical protein